MTFFLLFHLRLLHCFDFWDEISDLMTSLLISINYLADNFFYWLQRRLMMPCGFYIYSNILADLRKMTSYKLNILPSSVEINRVINKNVFIRKKKKKRMRRRRRKKSEQDKIAIKATNKQFSCRHRSWCLKFVSSNFFFFSRLKKHVLWHKKLYLKSRQNALLVGATQ